VLPARSRSSIAIPGGAALCAEGRRHYDRDGERLECIPPPGDLVLTPSFNGTITETKQRAVV